MKCLNQFLTLSLSLRRRRRQKSKIAPPASSHCSLPHKFSLTSQLISVLHTRSPQYLFRSLDLAVRSPKLTAHIISTVLSHPIPFPSSFYFYSWASSFGHLESWRSRNLIVSILQSNIRNMDSFCLLDDIKSNLSRPISSFAFVVLFRAYHESGLIENALEVFRRMPEYISRPDTLAYNTVLDALVKKGADFLIMGVYKQMLKTNCYPDKATFCILINGCCKAGMFDDALKLIGEMQSKGLKPDEILYTIVLSAYCRMQLIDEAEIVFDSMKKSGYRIDYVVCHAMLSGYCKLGKMDVALNKLVEYEKEFGFVLRLEGYCSFIDGLFKAKKFQEACRVYEVMLMKNIQPDCIMYTVMIRGFLEVGSVKEAFKILKKMSEVGIAPNAYSYNTLMKGLCDVGFVEKARFLMLSMYENGIFPDSTTYSIMITGLCKHGLVHDAWQVFHEMSEFAIAPNINSYNSLIDGLCKAGMYDDARYLFDNMNVKPSVVYDDKPSLHCTYVFRKKIEEMCEMGHVVDAYKLFRGIMGGAVPSAVTFNVWINRLFKAGKPNEAMQLFKVLNLIGIKSDEYTYSTVIDGLLSIRKFDEAFNVCQSMLKDMIIPNLALCYSIMKLYCNAKRVMHAIKFWLNHISITSCTVELDRINSIKNHFDQGYIEAGVEKLIERDIEHNSKKSSPYTIWLFGFCLVWKIDEAIMIFNTLVKFDIEVTAPSCVILINRLCSLRELGSAYDVMVYTIMRGFSLNQSVGNQLLMRLCLGNRKTEAQELVWRMSLAGYDMDTYLRCPTKRLLYGNASI